MVNELLLLGFLSRNLLDQQQEEFSSDEGEEEEEFVPSRKELREEEEEDEQEGVDSGQEEEQEEVTRRGQRTPRSQQKKKKSRRVCPSCLPLQPRLTFCSDCIHFLFAAGSTRNPSNPSPCHSQHPQQVTAGPAACQRPGGGPEQVSGGAAGLPVDPEPATMCLEVVTVL